MGKSDLINLLESTSLSDLKSLVTAKEKMDKLLAKKSSIEKDLAEVEKDITSIQGSLGKAVSGKKRGRKPGPKPSIAVRAKRTPATRGKKSAQGSIESLILEILQEKQKPLSVNEIADLLLKEKGYKTKSANFKNQLRVLLYRNQKGSFEKVGAGQFGLAGSGKAPEAAKVSVKKKAVAKKKKVAKKTATRKKARPPDAARATSWLESARNRSRPSPPAPMMAAMPSSSVGVASL